MRVNVTIQGMMVGFSVALPILLGVTYLTGYLFYSMYLSFFSLDYSMFPREFQALVVDGFFSFVDFNGALNNLIENYEIIITYTVILSFFAAYSLSVYEFVKNPKSGINLFSLQILKPRKTSKLKVSALDIGLFWAFVFLLVILPISHLQAINHAENAFKAVMSNITDDNNKKLSLKYKFTVMQGDECRAYAGYMISCGGVRCAFVVKKVGTVLISENYLRSIEPFWDAGKKDLTTCDFSQSVTKK